MMWLSRLTFCRMLNVAVTCSSAFSVTEQVGPLPLHPLPAHPAKYEFAPGVSVKVTWVPVRKAALHAGGQLIPAGALVTVPVPVPLNRTLSTGDALTLNVAVTELLAFNVTLQ